MTNSLSGSFTTQMRNCFWNLVSTPRRKSDGYPTEKTVSGSNKVRGKKKRKNIRKLTPRYPQMQAQIRRRRILSGSTAALLSAETFAAGFCPAAATGPGGAAGSRGVGSVCSALDCAPHLWNWIAKGQPTPLPTFLCNAPGRGKHA